MEWKHPPIIKIYEALGAVADGRIEVSGNTGKVFSSTGNKFYDVSYDPDANAIMTNDNASFWKGYLGYPAIAYLMKIGTISYNDATANLLKGVAWKDINQKFKNDFEKTLECILSEKSRDQRTELATLTNQIDAEIKSLDLQLLGKKTTPPAGY